MGVWKRDSCNNPKTAQRFSTPQKNKRSCGRVSVDLVRLLRTAPHHLLQHNLYSHFPSLIYRTFNVLLVVCEWKGWGVMDADTFTLVTIVSNITEWLQRSLKHICTGMSGKILRCTNLSVTPPLLCLSFKASRPLNKPIKWAKDSQNDQIFASTLSSLCSLEWTSSNCESLCGISPLWKNFGSETRSRVGPAN